MLFVDEGGPGKERRDASSFLPAAPADGRRFVTAEVEGGMGCGDLRGASAQWTLELSDIGVNPLTKRVRACILACV